MKPNTRNTLLSVLSGLVLVGLAAAMLSLLSGCALLDGFFLEPLDTEDGRPLFVDETGDLTTEAINPVTGESRDRAYTDEPSAVVEGASGLASGLGPWGAAAGAGLGLLSGLYATIRGRKKVNAEKAKGAAWRETTTLLVSVLEDVKTGAVDVDDDGRISLDELKTYLAKRGREALKPEFIQRVVQLVSGSMSESDRQKALEDAAARYARG